ncbi:DUF4255 domain-containing protein [Calothrix sp. FACHB-156]|nr:DUF4255 domain-containing protein [Calothrix sp. FACHB-156]
MFNDLDKTLEELLRRELPATLIGPEATSPVGISFATPDQDFATSKPSNAPVINLFLYDVRENLELRSNQGSLIRQHDENIPRSVKTRPPVRVDCSYLVTVWSASIPPSPEQEHQILGEVIKALIRYPRIPAQVLKGSLVGQEPPLRALTLRPTLLQSLGEFWQAMGGKPRPAINYTVTLAIPVYNTEESVPLVTDMLIAPQQSIL